MKIFFKFKNKLLSFNLFKTFLYLFLILIQNSISNAQIKFVPLDFRSNELEQTTSTSTTNTNNASSLNSIFIPKGVSNTGHIIGVINGNPYIYSINKEKYKKLDRKLVPPLVELCRRVYAKDHPELNETENGIPLKRLPSKSIMLDNIFYKNKDKVTGKVIRTKDYIKDDIYISHNGKEAIWRTQGGKIIRWTQGYGAEWLLDLPKINTLISSNDQKTLLCRFKDTLEGEDIYKWLSIGTDEIAGQYAIKIFNSDYDICLTDISHNGNLAIGCKSEEIEEEANNFIYNAISSIQEGKKRILKKYNDVKSLYFSFIQSISLSRNDQFTTQLNAVNNKYKCSIVNDRFYRILSDNNFIGQALVLFKLNTPFVSLSQSERDTLNIYSTLKSDFINCLINLNQSFTIRMLYIYNPKTCTYTILNYGYKDTELSKNRITNLYISCDQSIIVGSVLHENLKCRPFIFKYLPFIWTQKTGMLDLKTWLKQNNVEGDFKGWNFQSINGISPNGQFICGHGKNPEGDHQGFYIDLRERKE